MFKFLSVNFPDLKIINISFLILRQMEGTEDVSNFRGKRVIALFDVD